MKKFWNKLWNKETLRESLPYTVALFVVTSLWPCGIKVIHEGLYAYQFGLMPYLTLYQRGFLTDKVNLFKAIGGAESFFVAVPGIIGCGLLCYLLSVLFRLAVSSFNRRTDSKGVNAAQ